MFQGVTVLSRVARLDILLLASTTLDHSQASSASATWAAAVHRSWITPETGRPRPKCNMCAHIPWLACAFVSLEHASPGCAFDMEGAQSRHPFHARAPPCAPPSAAAVRALVAVKSPAFCGCRALPACKLNNGHACATCAQIQTQPIYVRGLCANQT